LPDFAKPFMVETDASGFGLGVMLMQEIHPLAFISKPLGQKLCGLSTYEEEYIAILLAVEQWKTYLQHNEFHIYTDQKSLVHLNDLRLHTVWQQKVFTKLLDLNYRIMYKGQTIVQLMPCHATLLMLIYPSWLCPLVSLSGYIRCWIAITLMITLENWLPRLHWMLIQCQIFLSSKAC
jgi:hypothetical protein